MSRPLPSVEHVGDGVWSIPVPIPESAIGWIFVYALVGDDGVWLVDAGWDRPESRGALEAGLAEASVELSDVTGILVTHVHADHYGLAGWIREESDCWIGMHPADAAHIRDRYQDPTPLLEQGDRWLRSAGVPEDTVATLRDASLRVLGNVHAVVPDRDLRDGNVLDSPVGEVRVVHTPGHTPGHLCFDLPSHGAVFTGDHLLQRITPIVGWHPQSDADPLGDYLGSLDRIVDLAAPRALPGHVHAFGEPAERARELAGVHAIGLDRVVGALADGATTAWEVARSAHAVRWDALVDFNRRLAVADACAKLVRLEDEGRVSVDRHGTPWRYAVSAAEVSAGAR